jgi:DNA-binding CsgD family transcriptional regulator
MEQHIEFLAKQRKRIALVLIFTCMFYLYDLADDWVDGEPLFHLIAESICISISLGVSVILWRSSFRSFEISESLFREKLALTESETARWKNDATRLIEGLSQAIDDQFGRWKLTYAEKEVALLLLKGFSYNEIAAIRSTSERTVREQSSGIYQKSKLTGRAQLAAFFLEDLFLPSTAGRSPEESPVART